MNRYRFTIEFGVNAQVSREDLVNRFGIAFPSNYPVTVESSNLEVLDAFSPLKAKVTLSNGTEVVVHGDCTRRSDMGLYVDIQSISSPVKKSGQLPVEDLNTFDSELCADALMSAFLAKERE